VVANAGVGAYALFLEMSTDRLDEMIDVNLKGTLVGVWTEAPASPAREQDGRK
jgi:NAD(P)-dependent dehydrogenase (short-subunit alcohol dehydrogenase family)